MTWSTLGTGILVLGLFLASIALSLWRIIAGNEVQRGRGLLSLVVIGATLFAVIVIGFIFLQTGGLSLQQLVPGSSAPGPDPTIGPSFATPPGGGALP